jgi:hypothetical protein
VPPPQLSRRLSPVRFQCCASTVSGVQDDPLVDRHCFLDERTSEISEPAPSSSDTIRQDQARQKLMIKSTSSTAFCHLQSEKEGNLSVDFLIKMTLDSAKIRISVIPPTVTLTICTTCALCTGFKTED